MLFRKRDHLVGLDIGSSLIKVAEIKDTARGPVLKKFGVAKIAPGSIVDGSIQDVGGIAKAIRALFKTHKIKEKNVAISTGGYSVVIKTISLPTTSEQELHESIRFEAEQYIPYDVEDVNIDFQILGTSTFSPDQMNVLLVAVKKDLVAEYMDLTHMAGLNPCIIDVDTFALQNIHEIVDTGREDQVVMLVDVGYSKTSLNILKGTTSLMMRDNSSGIAQIIEEIVTATGCTPGQAEDALWGEESGAIPQEEVDAIRGSIVQKWCSEIYSVVNTYQSKSSEGILDRVVLCGGGAFVEGFSDSLAAEVAAEVAIIDPFSGLSIDEGQFSDALLKKMAPLAPIALGLALRKVDDK